MQVNRDMDFHLQCSQLLMTERPISFVWVFPSNSMVKFISLIMNYMDFNPDQWKEL